MQIQSQKTRKLDFIADGNWKFSVMIGSDLSGVFLCELHSKPTEEMNTLLRMIPKEDTLCC